MSDMVVITESSVSVVEIEPGGVDLLDSGETTVIEVGIHGERGEQGEPGPAGGTLKWDQLTPSATWVIVHNLGFFPNITVEDSGGNEHEPNLTYDSINQVTLGFNSAFGGVAYLS
jgi:hypothetical protein